MQVVKSWMTSLVAATVICSVVTLVSARVPAAKAVKFAGGIFVLLSLTLPLSQTDIFESDYTKGISELLENHELEQKAVEQTARILEDQIESETGAYISSLGIGYEKITARVKISDSKQISVESVEISIVNLNNEIEKTISGYVSDCYGVVPRITELTENKE